MSYENDIRVYLESGCFTRADAANIWATLAVLDELRKIRELLTPVYIVDSSAL